MNERAQRRQKYLKGYNDAFMRWWDYSDYYFTLEFKISTCFPPYESRSRAEIEGYWAGYNWVTENMEPVTSHKTGWMLWERPVAAQELMEAMLKDLQGEKA